MATNADDPALRALVRSLQEARDAAARVAGRPPLGLRAVESATGRRSYLCAFEGPAFLCLGADLEAEPELRRAREAASASLLWEHFEGLVDSEALRALAAAIGRLLALGGDPPQVSRTLEVVAARALELAAWRDVPSRAVASLPDLDAGAALQERLLGAYRRFLRASEPLVEVQNTLSADLVAALREVEQAAARAGAGERLADRLSRAVPECEEGAEQMVGAHLTRLR